LVRRSPVPNEVARAFLMLGGLSAEVQTWPLTADCLTKSTVSRESYQSTQIRGARSGPRQYLCRRSRECRKLPALSRKDSSDGFRQDLCRYAQNCQLFSDQNLSAARSCECRRPHPRDFVTVLSSPRSLSPGDDGGTLRAQRICGVYCRAVPKLRGRLQPLWPPGARLSRVLTPDGKV
jgi:hypothetical protein